MGASAWRTRVVDALWLIAWGVASSAWCLTAAGQLSATFDEPLYLPHGPGARLVAARRGAGGLARRCHPGQGVGTGVRRPVPLRRRVRAAAAAAASGRLARAVAGPRPLPA